MSIIIDTIKIAAIHLFSVGVYCFLNIKYTKWMRNAEENDMKANDKLE